jgi:hypothetical protein
MVSPLDYAGSGRSGGIFGLEKESEMKMPKYEDCKDLLVALLTMFFLAACFASVGVMILGVFYLNK